MRRRTLAKGMCEQKVIELNGRGVKAGHPVSVGDRITIHTPERSRVIEVLFVPVTADGHTAPPATREQRAASYRVLEEKTHGVGWRTPTVEVTSSNPSSAETSRPDADPLASVKTSPE